MPEVRLALLLRLRGRVRGVWSRDQAARALRYRDQESALADRGEADDRDDVPGVDVAVVQLAQEAGHLLRPPDLGVVVLDLARRQLLERLDLDLVDDRVEDPLPRAEARAREHLDDHPLLVLRGFVAEPDGRG